MIEIRCQAGNTFVSGWVGWLVAWLVGWSAGWLVGWLLGWSAGWLAGWLLWLSRHPTRVCLTSTNPTMPLNT